MRGAGEGDRPEPDTDIAGRAETAIAAAGEARNSKKIRPDRSPLPSASARLESNGPRIFVHRPLAQAPNAA